MVDQRYRQRSEREKKSILKTVKLQREIGKNRKTKTGKKKKRKKKVMG